MIGAWMIHATAENLDLQPEEVERELVASYNLVVRAAS